MSILANLKKEEDTILKLDTVLSEIKDKLFKLEEMDNNGANNQESMNSSIPTLSEMSEENLVKLEQLLKRAEQINKRL